MSENKTKPNQFNLDDFLAGLSDDRRNESLILIDIMKKVSGEEPVMWGSSIIGFGSIHYKYPSGREGDTLNIGFSPRKAKISLYMTYDASNYREQLDDMGKYSAGKGCVYVNRLKDIDLLKLEKLLKLIYRVDNKYQVDN